MLKYLSAAASLLIFTLVSCTSQPESLDSSVLAFNSFDQMEGWVGELPGLATLSKVKAHSLPYSTAVAPGSDYSLGFNNSLGKLTSLKPGKIVVKAWVLVPNKEQNARLVIDVQEPKNPKSLLYDALELRTAVKNFGQWEQVEHEITLPATITANSRLLIYMWRADSSVPVYLDDMQISLPK